MPHPNATSTRPAGTPYLFTIDHLPGQHHLTRWSPRQYLGGCRQPRILLASSVTQVDLGPLGPIHGGAGSGGREVLVRRRAHSPIDAADALWYEQRPDLAYSHRNATIGSTLVARRAGM